MTRVIPFIACLVASATVSAQPPPTPNKVDSPTVKVLTGLTVPALNRQFFPDHTPAKGESTLGRVTCYTCHQGEVQPKTAP